MWYTYVLESAQGSLIKGCTQDLPATLEQHQQGLVEATRPLLPLELIFHAVFPDKNKALDFERYLKSGSGRSFLKRHVV